jgi:DNA-binding CsgD family transcriptional regulator
MAHAQSLLPIDFGGAMIGLRVRGLLERDHVRLTATEREVAALLLSGQSPADVAISRSVSLATVRSHVKHLHHKFGTHSPPQLLLAAQAHVDCCVRSRAP